MFYKVNTGSITSEALYANDSHADRLMSQDLKVYDPFFKKQPVPASEVSDHLEGMEAYTRAWEEWLMN